MALDRTNDPQLVHSEALVSDILDVNSKYTSLIDIAHNVGPKYAHNGSVARINTPKAKAVAVAEGDALSVSSDVTFSLANMSEYKFGNLTQYSTEWEDDSFSAARENLASDIVRSHQLASDEAVLNTISASSDISESTVTDVASLSLSDIFDACTSLSFQGLLPSVYASSATYQKIKSLEAASGLLSESGHLLGMTWVPIDLPAASASGDLVLMVGDLSREVAVSDKGLRIAADGESSAANAINDQVSVFSYHRFSLGLWGNGSSLVRVVIA